MKELEKAGIPTVLICTLTSIAATVGANRVVPALGIPHPLGDPRLAPAEETSARRNLVVQALHLLAGTESTQKGAPQS